jgi:hypothetical protein
LNPDFILNDNHLSGRYVDENESPALLVSQLVGSLAIISVYSYGFWPIPGHEANFTETKSIVWYRGGRELFFFTMYDPGGCNLEAKFTCEKLEDYLFPTEAERAAELLGGWLNLTPYDSKVHEFDESVVDDMETFTTVWKKYSKLKTVNFVSPRPKLHEVEM